MQDQPEVVKLRVLKSEVDGEEDVKGSYRARNTINPDLQEKKKRVLESSQDHLAAFAVGSMVELQNNKSTLDYFDENFGVLRSRERPCRTEFACSLLREVLLALTEPSVIREKLKLGTLLLHLSTATQEFDWLFDYFAQVEADAQSGKVDWYNYEESTEFQEEIINNVKKELCSTDMIQTKLEEVEKKEDIDPVELRHFLWNMEDDMLQDDETYEPDNDAIEAEEPEFKPERSSRAERAAERYDRNVKRKERKEKSVEQEDLSDEVVEKKPPKKKLGRPLGVKNKTVSSAGGAKEKKKQRKSVAVMDDAGKKKYVYIRNRKQCNQCPYIADGEKALNAHLFNEHSLGSLCSECGYSSQSFQEYEIHMETHMFNCDQCSYSGLGLKRLKKHKQSHAPKKPKQADAMLAVQCDICGKEVRKKYLYYHMKNFHSAGSFPCDMCEYVGSSRDYLRAHKSQHTIKTQQCPVCDKKVKYLYRHMKRNCSGIPKQPVPCELCDKVLVDAQHLKKHVDIVHKKIKNTLCDLCDYKTYSLFNLRLHMSNVHDKKSLETICKECGVKTMSIDNHMKTYHIEVYVQMKKRPLAKKAAPAIVPPPVVQAPSLQAAPQSMPMSLMQQHVPLSLVPGQHLPQY